MTFRENSGFLRAAVCVLWCSLASTMCLADTQPLVLALRSASPVLPANGTAQIQVFAPQPLAITGGSFLLTFDATFGAITNADVFSATGDQSGYAKISGNTVEVHFRSTSGGVGRLPNLPVAVVNVKVQAASGTSSGTSSGNASVTLTSDAVWADVPGYQYTVPPATQTFPVGKAPYIDSVNFTGSPIKFFGGGFQAGTTVQMESASIGSIAGDLFGTGNELDVTLASSLELTGKRVTFTGPDGSAVNYFGGVHGPVSAPNVDPVLAAVQPIFPSRPFAQGYLATTDRSSAGILAVQNATAQPVQAAFTSSSPAATSRTDVTLAPGSIYFAQAQATMLGGISLLASAPLRVLGLLDSGNQILVNDAGTVSTPAAFQTTFGSGLPAKLIYAPGTPAQAPFALHVQTNGFAAPFNVAVNPEAASWLKLSPATGTTCDLSKVASGACSDASAVVVTIDPSSLAPGSYHADLTITVNYPNAAGSVTGLDLQVVPALLSYSSLGGGQYRVSSTPASVPFSASATTKDGSNWLHVTPSSASTPAVITVTQDRDPTLPDSTGAIQITGAGQTLFLPVSFTSPYSLFGVPPSLSYGVIASEGRRLLGMFNAFAQSVPGVISASVATDDGAPWLEAFISSGHQLLFYANAAGNHLAPGTYHATVSLQSSVASATTRVSLVVYNPSSPWFDWISISQFVPLQFTSTAFGTSAPLNLKFDAGNVPLFARVQTPPWLDLSNIGAVSDFAIPSVPGTFTFVAHTGYSTGSTQTTLTPGTYNGNVRIDLAEAFFGSGQEGQVQTLTLPVTYTVTPATTTPAPPPGPPFLNTLVSAASATTGAVAPGEIVTLYGLNIGPDPAQNLTLDATGRVSANLSGTQILFNGTPAPLLFAGAAQVNAVVPYEAGTTGSVLVELVHGSFRQTLGTLPLAASAPGMFTLNSSGTGPAAALNQDLSLNTTSNPAARGSIAVLYATGEGLTDPASTTGLINGVSVPKPLLPVRVFIGGMEATVTYAGSTPYSIAGLLQVNAIIPNNVAPGPAVPVELRIGGVMSPASATIAVQ